MQHHMERNIGKGIRIGIMIVIGLVLFVTVGGFVVRGLWNWRNDIKTKNAQHIGRFLLYTVS